MNFLEMGKRVILKLLKVVAEKEYEDWHDTNDEDNDWSYYMLPMWRIPDTFRNIIGLSADMYENKSNWFFTEILKGVDFFDFGCKGEYESLLVYVDEEVDL
jgi:hypothetical protein